MTISKKNRRIIRRAVKMIPGRDELAAKWRLAQYIERHKEDGEILIVENGRDCDGAEWRDRTFRMKANVLVYLKAYEDKAQWADGPFYWEIERMSNRSKYRMSTRDLALEAFEDGHDHVIYSNL